MCIEKELKNLAPHAFDEFGELLPFKQQVINWSMDLIGSSELLVVSKSPSTLNLPMLDNATAVTIDQDTLKKALSQHHLTKSELAALATLLTDSPISFESITQENSIVAVLDLTDYKDRHVIVPIHIDKTTGDIKHEVLVNDVASVFGKRNLQFLMNNTALVGAKFFVRECTEGWLSRTGLQLPSLAANQLIYNYKDLPLISEEDFSKNNSLEHLCSNALINSLSGHDDLPKHGNEER